jgi:electron transfer flavoprotein beta subunit
MHVLVCVKRVPAPGARIVLTDDGLAIDTRHLGFTVSPHEECAVEEAVRLTEAGEGRSTVLTLGPDAAEEQLRTAISMGIGDGVLLATEQPEWDPRATAAAIAAAVTDLEDERGGYDLILLGAESADAANHQVGIRLAHALGRPVVTGVKGIDPADAEVTLRRDVAEGHEIYRLPLPAVACVKEGLNLPRYPSMRGRLTAKKAPIDRREVAPTTAGLTPVGLRTAPVAEPETVVLGHGADAAPAVVSMLEEVGVL